MVIEEPLDVIQIICYRVPYLQLSKIVKLLFVYRYLFFGWTFCCRCGTVPKIAIVSKEVGKMLTIVTRILVGHKIIFFFLFHWCQRSLWHTPDRYRVSHLPFSTGKPVLRIRIRIHRIHMFLGLLDPDPLVRGMDPDPDPSVIKQSFLLFCDFFLTFYFLPSLSKFSKKNLHFYSFVTSFWLFVFEKLSKSTFKK